MSRPRRYDEAMRKDPFNMKHISEDAVTAKSSGVSYGKYKAGIGIDYESTEYPVSVTSYIRPNKTDADKKPVSAIIKLR